MPGKAGANDHLQADNDILHQRVQALETELTRQTQLITSLQHRTELDHLLAEHATDVIWLRDLQLKPLYISPSVTRLRGFSVEEVMVQSLDEAVTPTSAAIARQALAEAMRLEQSGEPAPGGQPYELEVTCKDGSTAWVETRVAFVRDPQGAPTGIVGVQRDITEQKRIAEALRQSETQYRSLVENSLGLICSHDLEGRLLSINAAAAQALGYSPQEAIGRRIQDFLAPAFQPQFSAYLARIQEQPMITGIMRVVTKAGEERLWQYRNVRMDESGDPAYVLGHAQDITELIRAQEALKISQEHYRLLVEGSIQGLYIHQDGYIQLANAALARLFGYNEPSDLIGQPYEILVAPHERSRLEGCRTTRFREGVVPERYEFQGVRRDGALLWVECMVSRIVWYDAPAILTTFIDITARKEAEAQATQMLTQLQQHRDDMLAILDQLELGIVMTDAQGRLTFLSQTCQALLGGDTQTILGKSWEAVCPFDAASKVEFQALQRARGNRAQAARLLGMGRTTLGDFQKSFYRLACL